MDNKETMENIRFIKYSSLEQKREKSLLPFDGKEVIITEKIHGSNFQIADKIINNKHNIKYGKRSGWIEENENFFQYKSAMEDIIENIKNMNQKIYQQSEKNNCIIRIYGELYGGFLDGKKNNDITAVQTGKYSNYSKYNRFRIFDIYIDNYHLEWDRVLELCKEFLIPTVPEICRGIYPQVIEDNNINVNDMESYTSKDHGETTQKTYAEGIVISSIDNSIKYKVKWKCDNMLENKSNKIKNKDENNKNKHDNFIEYINQNRFDTFISKVGPDFVSYKNINECIKELVLDAIQDIKKDNDELGNSDIKKFKKQLSIQARKLVIEYLKST
jgi:Rnl2 family RNA ligase